jgi:hypothetical protein
LFPTRCQQQANNPNELSQLGAFSLFREDFNHGAPAAYPGFLGIRVAPGDFYQPAISAGTQIQLRSTFAIPSKVNDGKNRFVARRANHKGRSG